MINLSETDIINFVMLINQYEFIHKNATSNHIDSSQPSFQSRISANKHDELLVIVSCQLHCNKRMKWDCMNERVPVMHCLPAYLAIVDGCAGFRASIWEEAGHHRAEDVVGHENRHVIGRIIVNVKQELDNDVRVIGNINRYVSSTAR